VQPYQIMTCHRLSPVFMRYRINTAGLAVFYALRLDALIYYDIDPVFGLAQIDRQRVARGDAFGFGKSC
jgi:hypothetical protein